MYFLTVAYMEWLVHYVYIYTYKAHTTYVVPHCILYVRILCLHANPILLV